jgi:hypothetical protein
LFRIARVQNGREVYEFNRCNNHWYKPRPNSARLAYVLRRETLEILKATKGYMIVYTHLGMVQPPPYIPLSTQSALRSLADEYRAGEIYVTTTARLLTYCLTHQCLNWSYDIFP